MNWFRRLGFGVLPLALVACGQDPQHAPPAAVSGAADVSGNLGLSGASDPIACVGTQVAAEALPIDMLALVDGSSSMQEATATGVSKWYATKAAFREFLEHAPTGMGFGLAVFPTPSDSIASCASSSYRDAAMAISDVGQMAAGALERLDQVTPRGPTPTAPAYLAALELASARASQHPERSVVVVLATDGLPTTCAPTDVPALAELARQALNGPGHVRTLVVLSKSLSGASTSGFEQIALAGGTARALAIDPHGDFTQQLSGALTAAATRQVTCDLAVPEPPIGEHLDYDAVNVVLQADDRSVLPRVARASDCNTAGGWYYDVDPSLGAPSRLSICPASCDHAAALPASSLQVEFGCKTLVR